MSAAPAARPPRAGASAAGPAQVQPPGPLAAHEAYASPRAACDVVMRGGVTSGVVYPWAVCELARHYRLVEVGGTSAGAIAAAASAAAEHARDGGATGRGGFPVLAHLPGVLAAQRGGRSTLAGLFSPERATAPLLELLLAVLAARDGGSWPRALGSGVAAAARAPGGGWRLLAGAAPGLALLLAAGGHGVPAALGAAAAGLAVLGAAAAARVARGRRARLVTATTGAVLLLAAGVGAAVVLGAAGPAVVAVLGWLALAAGVLVAAAAVHLRALRTAVPRNLYGVCSGMPAGGPTGDRSADGERVDDGRGSEQSARVLTPWITDLLDEAAGLPPGSGPLLFGHLWAGPGAAPLPGLDEAPPDAAVRLQVVTTSVTHGRPVRIPFDPTRASAPALYVHPAEMRRLLPERVVAWLEEHPPPLPQDPAQRLARRARDALLRPLVPLPAASDLPVVVAVRASLSFPLLLSAVPFHAVAENASAPALRRLREVVAEVLEVAPLAGGALDGGAPAADGRSERDDAALVEVLGRLAGARPTTYRVWTTDGGVTSNFPIHFFDTFAPARPTFGVTLRPAREPSGPGAAPPGLLAPDHRDSPSLDADPFEPDPLDPGDPGPVDDALPPVLHPLDEGPPSTWRFVRAVAATTQDWSDVVQLPLPGFRDRIAQVDVDPGDGGWDLGMRPEAIARLAERGRAAGVALRERFTAPGADGWTGWERHRWTRLRADLPLLETAAEELAAALDPASAPAGERDLRDLLRLPVDEAPAHRWTGSPQRRRAQHALAALLEASPEGVPPRDRLDAGAPEPALALRYVPRDGT